MSERRSSWIGIMWQSLRQPHVLLGGVLPAVVFYIVRSITGDGVVAALVAGGAEIVVLVAEYALRRRINALGLLALGVLAVSLTGTLLTRDENFYLAEPAITNALVGVIFLISLLFPRSLMQIIVEEVGVVQFSEQMRQSRPYRRVWQIETVVWGVVRLMQAALLLIMQAILSLEVFLTLRTALGWAITGGLLLWSFWYPGYYWSRHFGTG